MLAYLVQLALIFVLFGAAFWLAFWPGQLPRLRDVVFLVVLAATSTFLIAPAWAADAVDAHISIPIGDLLNEFAVPVFAAITAVIAWLIRKLPASAKAWIDTMRVEQLLDKAAAYGVNSVVGAAKGQTLTVNTHLPVLAYMLQYALDRIPDYLLKWVGGPTKLAEMMWARADVSKDASRPDLETLAEAIASGSSVSVAIAKAKVGGA